MRFFHTDVLCIGAGLAGERVAIEAAKAGQTDDDGTDDEEPPQFGAADPV